MIDYICRQDAIDALECVNGTREVLESLPSARALPIIFGCWRGFTHTKYQGTDKDGEPIFKEYILYHCSECNRTSIIQENYCPQCGAKMMKGD